MGSKMRLSSYSIKRGDNTVNLVTSHKTNARLEHLINATKCLSDNVYRQMKIFWATSYFIVISLD